MKTKLFSYPILALTLALSNLTINPPAANAQSINYSCQDSQRGFITVGRSMLRLSDIINWGNRQEICNRVSARFQEARDNGNLRFIMKEEDRVCGTNISGGECLTLLFSTNTTANASDSLRRLINGITIDSRYITESARREYFNYELYLQEKSTSTNQEISTNQLSSQP